jgi:hypothetical protein
MVGLYTLPLKYKCEYCGKHAWLACEVCKKKMCPEHTGSFIHRKCKACRSSGTDG